MPEKFFYCKKYERKIKKTFKNIQKTLDCILSEVEKPRFIKVLNSDKTGTNEYSIIRCTRNTADECEREFYGQLDDGVFENSRVGSWEEI